jgi:hypothetical protein
MESVFDWKGVKVFVTSVMNTHLVMNVTICSNGFSLTQIENMYMNTKLTDFPNTHGFGELMNTQEESTCVNIVTFCIKLIVYVFIANTGNSR